MGVLAKLFQLTTGAQARKAATRLENAATAPTTDDEDNARRIVMHFSQLIGDRQLLRAAYLTPQGAAPLPSPFYSRINLKYSKNDLVRAFKMHYVRVDDRIAPLIWDMLATRAALVVPDSVPEPLDSRDDQRLWAMITDLQQTLQQERAVLERLRSANFETAPC